MPSLRRFAVLLILVGLAATLTTAPTTATARDTPSVVETTSIAKKPNRGFTPPSGALLSDPLIGGRKRLILNRVVRSIRNTAKGEFIRTAVWNYDDRAVTNALIDANRRGVHVQIVVANSVRNANWNRTAAALNANPFDRSFAKRCRGGCRGGVIMHSKFVLISRVRQAKTISMVGSFNLTKPAGFRQWNDMVTTRDEEFYRSLVGTFEELAADRRARRTYQVTDLGEEKITLWPGRGRNTIREELQRVRCRIPAADVRDGQTRTRIRIAIAGWFDSFGTDIARTVRGLHRQGCNIKIITTLAGRDINRTLRSGRGVPIRQVSIDANQDLVPERYLHMKAVAIDGYFNGDPRADVLLTGSPNWSARANRSDEIIFRFLDVPKLVRQYSAHVDRLYGAPYSHRKAVSEALLRQVTGRPSPGHPPLPTWFELD